MTARLCDIPAPDHDGTARLYPCGWRCTSHAPQARTTAPAEPATTRPVSLATRRNRTTTVLQVTAALRIDCGEGFANKEAGPGEFSWKTHPRARYECVACGWTSETVTGAIAVRTFLNHIRATHKATCTKATTEGAQAA